VAEIFVIVIASFSISLSSISNALAISSSTFRSVSVATTELISIDSSLTLSEGCTRPGSRSATRSDSTTSATDSAGRSFILAIMLGEEELLSASFPSLGTWSARFPSSSRLAFSLRLNDDDCIVLGLAFGCRVLDCFLRRIDCRASCSLTTVGCNKRRDVLNGEWWKKVSRVWRSYRVN
jgi:hypothetical protein